MLTCVQDILRLSSMNIYNASDMFGCPLACEFYDYDPSISFSAFPSDIAFRTLYQKGLMGNNSDYG
jgi:hypothetical protein